MNGDMATGQAEARPFCFYKIFFYLCSRYTISISLSIFSAVCIFTRKIDDCPAYGGFLSWKLGRQ